MFIRQDLEPLIYRLQLTHGLSRWELFWQRLHLYSAIKRVWPRAFRRDDERRQYYQEHFRHE